MQNARIKGYKLADTQLKCSIRRVEADPATQNLYQDAGTGLMIAPPCPRLHCDKYQPELGIFGQHLRPAARIFPEGSIAL